MCVCSGLAHLHSLDIVHRDVKAESWRIRLSNRLETPFWDVSAFYTRNIGDAVRRKAGHLWRETPCCVRATRVETGTLRHDVAATRNDEPKTDGVLRNLAFVKP